MPAPRGLALRGIQYELLDWEEPPTPDQSIDEISISVVLDFENGESFRLRWLMYDGSECLTTAEWKEGDPMPDSRMVDVSERWQALLGARVVGQHVAYQETDWGVEPWTCRLDFDNDRHLVVALGELTTDGTPTYIPDSLLVMSSHEVAAGYQPLAAPTSAWGQ